MRCLASCGTGSAGVFWVFPSMKRIQTQFSVACSLDRVNNSSRSFEMKILECAGLSTGTVIPDNVSMIKE